jgi:hypothetical protein
VCKNEEAWSFDIDTVEPIKVSNNRCYIRRWDWARESKVQTT